MLRTFLADMPYLVTLMATLASVTGLGLSGLVGYNSPSFTGLGCISWGFIGYMGVTYRCGWSKCKVLGHGGVNTGIEGRVCNLSIEWVDTGEEQYVFFGMSFKLISMGDKAS